MEDKIKRTQEFLKKYHMQGWLLYDFQKINNLALEFLEISSEMLITRRFFYFIPRTGSPVKIVHSIEAQVLNHLPGKTISYKDRKELLVALKSILFQLSPIAMEYSPSCLIPYLSKIDAGTYELISSFECKIVSSGLVLQHFTSTLDESQINSHIRAGRFLTDLMERAFDFIKTDFKNNKIITEYSVQQWIQNELEKNNFITDHEVICAFGKNTANPHYNPSKKSSLILKENDLILLDIFAKEKESKSIYADICQMGFVGKNLPQKVAEIINIVKKSQDLALEFLVEQKKKNKEIKGFKVDEICRDYIAKFNLQDHFTHRTGHNLYTCLHGPGAHLDSFETFDERPLIENTAYTIEPGLYFDQEFGVRLEIDILVKSEEIVVTTPIQKIVHHIF